MPNRRWLLGATFQTLAVALLVGSGSGCGGGAGTSGGSDDWYYHWDCHGDSECLALGPGDDNQASGTLNEGPVYANCSSLLRFASINWNIPPATNSCDQSPTGGGSDGTSSGGSDSGGGSGNASGGTDSGAVGGSGVGG